MTRKRKPFDAYYVGGTPIERPTVSGTITRRGQRLSYRWCNGYNEISLSEASSITKLHPALTRREALEDARRRYGASARVKYFADMDEAWLYFKMRTQAQ